MPRADPVAPRCCCRTARAQNQAKGMIFDAPMACECEVCNPHRAILSFRLPLAPSHKVGVRQTQRDNTIFPDLLRRHRLNTVCGGDGVVQKMKLSFALCCPHWISKPPHRTKTRHRCQGASPWPESLRRRRDQPKTTNAAKCAVETKCLRNGCGTPPAKHGTHSCNNALETNKWTSSMTHQGPTPDEPNHRRDTAN